MTSLIFGSIYLAHKGATGAYRDKQRRKNYERWEDLREEYDAQKKITRETRSLDMQRTGSGEFAYHDDRPVVSQRDLQEANDARTSWRPQESWDSSNHPPQRDQQQQQQQYYNDQARSASIPSTYWQNRGQLRPQRTGATWDDGLPAPLRVTRRSFDANDSHHYNQHETPSTSSSIHHDAIPPRHSSTQLPNSSPAHQKIAQPSTPRNPDEPVAMDAHFIQQLTRTPAAMLNPTPMQPFLTENLMKPPVSESSHHVQPTTYSSPVPGGRMAELIERGY